MSDPRKTNYLERIQRMSTHPMLRLMIEAAAGLAMLGIIAAAVILFSSGHPWLALYNLASLVLLYVLRSLAVLVVDIADMLIEQGSKEKPDAQPLSTPRSQ
jgi:hypothetical protein